MKYLKLLSMLLMLGLTQRSFADVISISDLLAHKTVLLSSAMIPGTVITNMKRDQIYLFELVGPNISLANIIVTPDKAVKREAFSNNKLTLVIAAQVDGATVSIMSKVFGVTSDTITFKEMVVASTTKDLERETVITTLLGKYGIIATKDCMAITGPVVGAAAIELGKATIGAAKPVAQAVDRAAGETLKAIKKLF